MKWNLWQIFYPKPSHQKVLKISWKILVGEWLKLFFEEKNTYIIHTRARVWWLRVDATLPGTVVYVSTRVSLMVQSQLLIGKRQHHPKSPRLFSSTRRLEKNSPGLFAHKSPTCCGHQSSAIVSYSFLLLSIAFYSNLSSSIALYCSLKSKLTPVSAIYSFQNLLLLIFFEKIWCKVFAVSKPCRTFALAKRNKAHRRVSWATFFERFS